jgi:glyoxylase-like metal-dependent hydrolase (beta-lactamase superfamily II)/8-oxo-dGTP pyrophosphatase MutT (NUDIX family)
MRALSVLAIFSFGDEIYMVKRASYLKIFPGYHSFPGGKIDDQDFKDLEMRGEDWESITMLRPLLLKAMKRELKEELDFHYYHEYQQGSCSSDKEWILLGMADTPSFQALRFRTYFIWVPLLKKRDFSFHDGELEQGEWRNIRDWYEEYQKGKMLLVPPTINFLRDFSQSHHFDKNEKNPLFNWSYKVSSSNGQTFIPYVESLKGIKQLFVSSCTLPPFDHTNAFIIGDSHSVVIDPSPKSEEELEKLVKTLHHLTEGKGIQEFFLTHSHPDHSQFIVQLCKIFHRPLSLSPDTACRLRHRYGSDYFQDVVLLFRRPGDVITTWLGSPVEVIALPGHDEGQIGLRDEHHHWYLVSDLFQGQGTVVVSSPEGDMDTYLSSLQFVIQQKPKFLLPSHGMIVGGTSVLEDIIRHRQEREETILALLKQGFHQDDILKAIYKDLHPHLIPLAMANIQAHYKRLRKYGKIIG